MGLLTGTGRSNLTRRDAILILLGALLMQIISVLFLQSAPPPPLKLEKEYVVHTSIDTATVTQKVTATHIQTVTHSLAALQTPSTRLSSSAPLLPNTKLLHHAPGWTLFENLYMANGTLFVIGKSEAFPEMRKMISVPIYELNTPENIRDREPTEKQITYVTAEQAEQMWKTSQGRWKVNTVAGNTILANQPQQFLRHYYHFVAELWFGIQAFWHGAHSEPAPSPPPKHGLDPTDPYAQFPLFPPHLSTKPRAEDYTYPYNDTTIPTLDRLILMNCDSNGWHDDPAVDSYFLRSAYPSLSVETSVDWQDRVKASQTSGSVYHFPKALLIDRSAAFRGLLCGTRNQRYAGEAFAYMDGLGRLVGRRVGGWWQPIRQRIIDTVGAPSRDDLTTPPKEDAQVGPLMLPLPKKIVITYISRQNNNRRKLTTKSDQDLIASVQSWVQKKNEKMHSPFNGPLRGVKWEFNVVYAESLSLRQQIQIAAQTTIMLGVHGNGLSHLIWMPVTRMSLVIEMFYPEGFLYDYAWTSSALGITYRAVWDDKWFGWGYDTLSGQTSQRVKEWPLTGDDLHKPPIEYTNSKRLHHMPGANEVEQFQSPAIPVKGATVVDILEEKVQGIIAAG